MKKFILPTFLLLFATAPAVAQHAPGFGFSPSPWHSPFDGNIATTRHYMAGEIAPMSCLQGTFISAYVGALGLSNRVRPDAQFWPHLATTEPHPATPWTAISQSGTLDELRGLPTDLQKDMLRHMGGNSDLNVVYTGADLIQRFGYRPC